MLLLLFIYLFIFCVTTFASVESWCLSGLNVRCFYTLLRRRWTIPWGLLKKKKIFTFLQLFLFWHFSFLSLSLVWRDTTRIADEDLGKIYSLLLSLGVDQGKKKKKHRSGQAKSMFSLV